MLRQSFAALRQSCQHRNSSRRRGLIALELATDAVFGEEGEQLRHFKKRSDNAVLRTTSSEKDREADEGEVKLQFEEAQVYSRLEELETEVKRFKHDDSVTLEHRECREHDPRF